MRTKIIKIKAKNNEIVKKKKTKNRSSQQIQILVWKKNNPRVNLIKEEKGVARRKHKYKVRNKKEIDIDKENTKFYCKVT